MNPALLRRLDGYAVLLGYAVAHWRVLRKQALRLSLLRQIRSIGIDALGTIAALGSICGVLVITQIIVLTGGDNETGIRVLIWVLVRELAPLLTALIIISRTSSAMASELALMRLHGEFSALERMGIPPEEYLLLPRIVGTTVAVVATTICFQTVAILSGLIAGSFQDTGFLQQMSHVLDVAHPYDLLHSAVKSLCFGLIIGSVAAYHGATAKADPAAIPRAGNSAVANSLLLVFMIDILFAGIATIAS